MNLDRIIEEFEAEHLLYTKEYYKELDQDEHADVEQILCKIGKKIEYNEKTQIYNDQIRNNLYNILSVIRNKTEDIKIKEEVNRLITILNKTDKYNADEYMYAQIFNRFKYFDKKGFTLINSENISGMEDEMYKYYEGDLSLVNSLIYDSDEDFIDKYYGRFDTMYNISYILVKHPEILNHINIKTRIEGYLTNLLSNLKSKNLTLSSAQIKTLKTNAKNCLNMVKKYEIFSFEEQMDELLNIFTANALIFGPNYRKLLKELDDDLLIELLDCLELFVKNNSAIYSNNIKKNFYEIFDYYCEKIKDRKVLKRINKLISILKKANGEKVKMFYIGQYNIRFSLLEKTKEIDFDIDTIEEMACKSIENDPIFLEQLLNCNEEAFVLYNIYNDLSFSNLSYLIFIYPDILQGSNILSKIYKLLEANRKEEGQLREENFIISCKRPKDLKEKSEALQKVLKKMN